MSWEKSDRIETISKFVGLDAPVSILIKDIEGICEVEVVALSKTQLVGLDVTLDSDDVTQTIDELVFISH